MTKFVRNVGPVLENARKTFEAGNLVGLIEAVPYCVDFQELPPWVFEGLRTALRHFAKTYKAGQQNGAPGFKQKKADFADFRCYRAVRAAMADGFKGEGKWDEAVRSLQANWKIFRSKSTVESAYKEVQAALKTEEGRLRYAAF